MSNVNFLLEHCESLRWLEIMESRFSVYVIDRNGNECPLQDWDRSGNGDAAFVCFSNRKLRTSADTDCSLVISRDYQSRLNAYVGNIGLRWQCNDEPLNDYRNGCVDNFYNRSFDNVIDQIDGHANTEFALRKGRLLYRAYAERQKLHREWNASFGFEKYLPAICAARDTIETVNGHAVHGFLPSLFQLKTMTENIGIINRAMKEIGAYPILYSETGKQLRLWSSNECDDDCAWFCNAWVQNEGGYKKVKTACLKDAKSCDYDIIPMFPIDDIRKAR